MTLLSILALSACNTVDTAPTDMEVVDPVGRIAGHVTDNFGEPIRGVTVSAQGLEVETDQDGYYMIEGVEPSDHIVLSFLKSGYAKSYGVTSLVSWEVATANRSMLEIDGYDFFDGDAGGLVKVGDVSVLFDGGTIVDADGNAYRGEVRTEVTHLDPWDPSELKAGPGDLRAFQRVDNDGKTEFESTQLVSYGMADISLYDDGGNPLNLAEGSSAAVDIPISNGELIDWYTLGDGDSQKTWSFDPDRGAWVEEGEGFVTVDEFGDMSFTFSATHFSWWNCDQGYVPTCATGRIVDELGFPVRSAELHATGAVTNSIVTTDEDGYYEANVFAGDNVTFTGTTIIPGDPRSWTEFEVEFIDGSTEDPSICQPIEDIEIPVCRETGMIATDNLTVELSEVDEGANADRLNAMFWQPPGDPEHCKQPWDFLPEETCRPYDPADFPTYGEFDEDGLPTETRDVGEWITIETDREVYTLDIEEDEPGQITYSYDVNSLDKDSLDMVETNDLDFQGGDVLGATSQGNAAEFLGPIDETNWVTLPPDLELDLSGPQSAPTGGMTIDFEPAGNPDGIIVMANGVGTDGEMDGSVVCRFTDDGSMTIPESAMDELGRGTAGMSIYRPNLDWTPGPDGYPVRVQAFSGTVVEVDLR